MSSSSGQKRTSQSIENLPELDLLGDIANNNGKKSLFFYILKFNSLTFLNG
jgi:hypothetical protein